MGLLNRIKNAFFEVEEVEDEEEPVKINDNRSEKIVTKIEPENIKNNMDLGEDKASKSTGPIIFDESDFIIEQPEPEIVITEKKEEVKLYNGYSTKEIKKEVKQFKVSPVISPVYGILNHEKKEEKVEESKSLDHLFAEDRKKNVTLDTIRQKAYGDLLEKENDNEIDDDTKDILLYNKEEDTSPVVKKVTLGDAEEYFDDLGLEYDIDYRDASKKKAQTRTSKNEELANKIIEEETLEKVKPKRKTKIKDVTEDEEDDVEEKNLYDLIDMMYKDEEE